MFILLSISFVSATQNNTITTNDNEEILTTTEDTLQTEETNEIITKNSNEDNLAADAGNFTELYNIFNTNNQIVLEKDYVAHSGDSYIYINQNKEVDGKGHTIDGGGVTTIFKTPADANINVVLKNLIIKNGYAKRGTGGAISFSSDSSVNLVIMNCTFINNKADFNAGAIEFTPKEGTLEISDSTFTGNHAMHGTGGAIRDAGVRTKIINSKFESNTAQGGDGGAVYISTDSNSEGVEIDNCIFNKNRVLREEAGFNGGAVRAKTATLKITNSNFTDNHVTGKQEGSQKSMFGDMDGGAIESEGRLELGGCYFKDNSAYDCGGAVAAKTILWLEKPCIFIHNHVETWNDIVANKGGAVYASRFENTAKGLIFINNSGYYGGAVYMREKGDTTFESCYFEGNTALTSGSKQGSGAAIYVDSSGSKLSLISNTFVSNAATSDSGILNCGKYGTYTGNWWGTNTPNFGHEKYIVEWHRVGSNDILTDTGYLQAVLRSDKTELYGENAILTLQIIDSQGKDFTGKLTNLDATFSSDKGGVFTNKQIYDNKITVSFTPNSKADKVTAKINNQILTLDFAQLGNFTKLEKEINAANGVLNLTHDYTYSIGIDEMYEGIVINKSLVINGNGHKIDALEKTRIFYVQASDVTFNNITFVRGFYSMGGAITIEGSNIKILNSKFINNTGGQYGGAIFSRSGNNLQITGCQFTNNMNKNEGGGAILIDTPNTKIEKTVFVDNTGTQGGALDLRRDNVTIDGCEFKNNVAINENRNGGGAINSFANNVTIRNSIFLNNKARSTAIQSENKDNTLILTLTGKENYINAINSEKNITFINVTYWDGTITNANPVRSTNESGQNITLEIRNSENKTIKKITITTNKSGQASFNYATLENGNYTFTATHPNDSYYTEISYNGKFNVTRPQGHPSEVKINIENKTEFEYGNCNITFEVINKTIVEVVITNENYTQVFYDNETNLSYIKVDLPASDEYYNIIVFNHGDGIYDPSSAEKSFKILKTNSTLTLNPVANVNYTDPVTVSYTGNGDLYNVTVYDINNTAVSSIITNSDTVEFDDLAAGEYMVTVINLGNENRTSTRNSTTFNVLKKDNRISVSINDAVYGGPLSTFISATVDGAYTLDINGTKIVVNVYDGYGAKALDFAAGSYKTNVIFDNPNYNNIIYAQDFIVEKAQSHVLLTSNNVTYGQNTTVQINDDFPTVYNITLYDEENNIVFHKLTNATEITIAPLNVGLYNLTVINLGNENITGSEDSTILNVTTENYVEIVVDDEEYGKEIIVMVYADVDGLYTVNINKTQLTIEVIYGFGYDNTLELDAGKYYANVTFDNPHYNSIIENTTFTIYPTESKLKIKDIENITYNDDVTIEYSAEYNNTFNVVIIDINEDIVFNLYTNVTNVIVTDLAAGNYTAMVTIKGNENILGSTEFKNFTVKKATPYINVTTENVTILNDVIVNVLSNVTGSYTIEFANKTQTITLQANKEEKLVYSKLMPDNYVFQISYVGNENYTSANATVPITVSKIDSEFKMNTTVDDKDVNITVNVNSNATGLVEIIISGKKFYAPVENGKAIFTNTYTAGTYVANVTYLGDNNFNSANNVTEFTIAEPELQNTTITLNVETQDNNVTITVLVDEPASGLVEININDKKLFAEIKNSTAIADTILPQGSYTVVATYLGDENYKSSNATETFTVHDHVKENITISAVPQVVDNTVTLTVNINSNATGFVEIIISGKKFYAPVENGKAIFTNTYTAGTYVANVTYLGDNNFNSANDITQFSIVNTTPELQNTTISIDVATQGNNVTITVLVDESVSGLVEININGDAVFLPVNNGIVVYDIIASIGNYTVTATYLGDEKFNPNSTSKSFEISKSDKKDTFISMLPVSAGNNVNITVSLEDDATGLVELNINGSIAYLKVENGTASYIGVLPDGKYDVNTTYLGDNKYNSNSISGVFTVSGRIKTVLFGPGVSVIYKANRYIVVTLKDENGKLLTNQKISIKINGKTRYVTVKNGLAKLTTKNLAPKTYIASIIFGGNGKYLMSSVNIKVKVNKAKSVITAKSKAFKKSVKVKKYSIILKGNNKLAIKKVAVTLKVNGKIYTAKTNSKGVAVFKINKLTKKGKFIAAIKFKGNKYYRGINKKVIILSR